jgi:hypothetical protein
VSKGRWFCELTTAAPVEFVLDQPPAMTESSGPAARREAAPARHGARAPAAVLMSTRPCTISLLQVPSAHSSKSTFDHESTK